MTVSLRYAVANILILDKIGFPKALSYGILGLEMGVDYYPQKRLPAAKLNTVFIEAAKKLGDPLIALRVGDGFRIGNFEETGKVYSFCKDLNEVLAFNAAYQPIAIDIGRISTVQDTDPVSGDTRHFVECDLYITDIKKIEHVFLLMFGSYGTAFRWLTWASARDLKGVYTQLPQPLDASLFEQTFRCPVYFDQPYNRIEFDEDSMMDQLSTYDPVRKAQYVAKLDALISSDNKRSSFLASLRQTILQGITSGHFSLPLIADKLNMSERKFRNELKKLDVKYRDYLEEVRKDLFIEKYESGMNFTDIAQELGYNDQSAFSKAFKRWYGMSPRAFKAQAGIKELS